MKKTIISTKNAPAAVGPYSQAVKVGNLLFASGQIPIDPETGAVVGGGIEAQTHQVLRNLRQVLAAAGADFSNVVKTTVFLTDIGSFATVNEIYASYFSEPYPARSAIQVGALPRDVLIEIELIAVVSPQC